MYPSFCFEFLFFWSFVSSKTRVIILILPFSFSNFLERFSSLFMASNPTCGLVIYRSCFASRIILSSISTYIAAFQKFLLTGHLSFILPKELSSPSPGDLSQILEVLLHFFLFLNHVLRSLTSQHLLITLSISHAPTIVHTSLIFVSYPKYCNNSWLFSLLPDSSPSN